MLVEYEYPTRCFMCRYMFSANFDTPKSYGDTELLMQAFEVIMF